MAGKGVKGKVRLTPKGEVIDVPADVKDAEDFVKKNPQMVAKPLPKKEAVDWMVVNPNKKGELPMAKSNTSTFVSKSIEIAKRPLIDVLSASIQGKLPAAAKTVLSKTPTGVAALAVAGVIGGIVYLCRRGSK